MVILTLLSPNQKPLPKWHFANQSIIRIGRQEDNDIVLDQFLEVSRYHLELRKIDSNWELHSQGTNGTFLNGFLTSKAVVKDNDLIQLAKEGPILKFESSSTIAHNSFQTKESKKTICNHAGNSPQNLFCIHCGAPLVEKEEFIRQYQILGTLGRGGMGITYLAWDKTGKSGSPRLLVLKEMNADMALIIKARELFEREARILKSLNHPGIPKYYDFFVEDEKKYLAMELVHGQNLEQKIYEKGPVLPQQATEWMIQVCQILEYLHSLQPPLVHRDVKPANLLWRNLDNRIILLDFGAVKEIGTPSGTRIGAEGYSAPEQSRGKPCPQSDIYAVGTTLIFLITGESPIRYYRRETGAQGYKFDLSNIPTITPKLAEAIAKATEPQLGHRFSTVQELGKTLTACLAHC
ncbi:MAG: protein kinase [Gomphosphaeria aponina SAG 52.96 = DSM 107014]|uniref:Protein kinase n=1 Tax=Gomphosphaeria aponina SAG 52.96 = DSM 107014 TaxID=1521640 RepID=A0A941GX64_9CHRO|nr:protein kinase [Gomphosphaeria aponina SAG 52.96 = DSM 107014]